MTKSADTGTNMPSDNVGPAFTTDPSSKTSVQALTATEREAINAILTRLQAQTGCDLSHYRTSAQTCAHYGFDFWQAISALLDEVGQPQRTGQTLERIADLIPNGIAIYDRTQAQTVFANRAFAKAYQRSPAEVLDMDAAAYAELIHPGDRPAVLADFAHIAQMADDEVLELEFRERTPTGDYRWLNERTVVFARDAIGQVTQQLAVTTDITARKQVEEALHGSQQFIEHLLSVTPSLLYIYDLGEQRNIFVNRSMYTTLGYQLSADEALRVGFVMSIMHPDDVAGYTAHLTGLAQLADGQTASFDYRLRHANGGWLWFHSQNAIFLRTANGAVRQIVGTATDITRHKVAEENVRRQAERRALLLAVTRLILESPAAGPALTEALFAQVREHLDADICFNYRIEDGMLHLVTSIGVPPSLLALVQRLEMNQAFCGTVAATCTPLMADAERIMSDPKGEWVRSMGIRAYACHPLFAGDGRPLGTLSFARTQQTAFTTEDMEFLQTICHFVALAWERQQATDALRQLNVDLEKWVADRTTALEQMNQELTSSNRELEQFNYAAAHDLKSPLRGIQHLVQWINEDAAAVLSPQSKKHLTLLRGRVQRLETLLDDMLAYSRIGRVHYAPERLDLNVIMQEIIDVIAPPDGFAVTILGPLPTVITRRVPLEIVFRNLISNAIKHHHQPRQGRVQVTAHTLSDGWVQFRIEDNGPGVAAQFHERIFGMFQTLRPRDQVEGSGVGLALVKKTVESYGGQITIESTSGQGAIFRFTWPIG